MQFKVTIEDWLINMLKEEIKDEWKPEAQMKYDVTDEDIVGWIYAWLINDMAKDSKMFLIHIANGNGLEVDIIPEQSVETDI